MTIEAELGANRDLPIPVDLVFIYDSSLIPTIESKSSSAWFQAKAGLIANANGALHVMSWRVTPGQDVAETPVDAPPGAIAVYLFADYAGRNDHPLKVDGSGTLAITLGDNQASIDVAQ